ncbi:MAG TPA: alpha/beta hydrolase [Methanomicrobia archaeon]|nr:alpha/beta hydrolase [Methanomicrobia archaeon]
MQPEKVQLTYKGSKVQIAYSLRRTQGVAVVFLHGLGCSKRDFQAAFEYPALTEYTLLTFDLPGCGDSPYPETLALDIDDLVEITHLVLSALQVKEIILVGHSMGGLVALLYTERFRNNVRGFINVEGNLSAEDCFFSRRVAQSDFSGFTRTVFTELKDRMKHAENSGFREYAADLEKADKKAYYDYSPSLVEYSDTGELLDRYCALDVPKLFIYGAENRSLSYLPRLTERGCALGEIPASNHFPFHDNPTAFYHAIVSFLNAGLDTV